MSKLVIKGKTRFSITIEVDQTQSIEAVCKQALELAKVEKLLVYFNYNDVEMEVSQDMPLPNVIYVYRNKRAARQAQTASAIASSEIERAKLWSRNYRAA